MIIEKLKLKDKLKQFVFILLILNNEVNYQINKINANYYSYAIFTNDSFLKRSQTISSNLTSVSSLSDQLSYFTYVCNSELNSHNKSYESSSFCLVSLVPSNNLFQKNEIFNQSNGFTSFNFKNEITHRVFYRKYFEIINQMQYGLLTNTHSTSNYLYDSNYDVTLYNPCTKYLIRKIINRTEFEKFKLDFVNFISSNKNENKIIKNISLVSESVGIDKQTSHFTSDRMKFIYNFETDRINDINQMYKRFLNVPNDDHLISLSLIQDKFTYNFFLHLKSKSGKSYLNQLYPDPSLPSKNYYFKFKKTTTFMLRLKSVEYYNIIKYEIYTPLTPSCNTPDYNSKDYKINERLPSSYLHCDNFEELAFYQELQQRGNIYN